MVVLVLVAAACGDDAGSGDGAGNGNGDMAPQAGGVVTVGQFSPPPGLDPAKLASASGTVGGMEQMALYDVIMGYDADTGEFVPRTAESLTANDDSSQWTLRLRPGITFTDGTPYDAEAVTFVHERQIQDGNANATGVFTSAVKSFTVVDPLTVVYELNQPWAGFPFLLAGQSGLIYSPTAYERAGENFNVAPGDAGAGPFKLRQYSPGEVIELERNPDYWGGDVYLERLRFVLIPGPAATFEAVKANSLTAGYVRDPAVVRRAEDENFKIINAPQPAGNMINMNSGEVTCRGGQPASVCADKADGEKALLETATSDIRVRRAVAHAVDPRVINDRVYDGAGKPNSAPFANSPWDPEIEGPQHDPGLARELIAAAKADGWDGRIRVLAGNDPIGVAWAQAVAAQLESVGMSVAVDTSGDIGHVIQKVLIQRDYDLNTWAYGISDESDGNYINLRAAFQQARYGYGHSDMVAAVELLRTADTHEERVAAYRAISEVWVRDVPAHVITEHPAALIFNRKLHGPQRTAWASMLFDKAWLEQ